MKIIRAGYQIMKPDLDDPNTAAMVYRDIEESGRTCYLSGASMTEESGEKFVRFMVKNGHDAMLEHTSMKVKFIVDRAISHQMIRHRICSFAEQSTRYCNFSKEKFGHEITVIEPCFYDSIPKEEKELCRKALDDLDAFKDPQVTEFLNNHVTDLHKRYARWYDDCRSSEKDYLAMLELGATPEEARSVLPHSLKTEIVVYTNMREWREIFKLRAAGEHGRPHPQILEVMIPLLNECKQKLPALFDDIEPMEVN